MLSGVLCSSLVHLSQNEASGFLRSNVSVFFLQAKFFLRKWCSHAFLHSGLDVMYQSGKCFCNISVKRIICFDFSHISGETFLEVFLWGGGGDTHTPLGLATVIWKHDCIIWLQWAIGARVMFPHPLFHQSWIKSSNTYKQFQNGFD